MVILICAAWTATLERCLAQGPSTASDLAAAAAVESALVDVISQAEKSVVAIARVAAGAQAQMQRDIEADAIFRELRLGINPQQPAPLTTGTGVIIDSEGLILTQYVVIDPDQPQSHSITTIDGKSHPAKIKAADPKSGLAVLEVDASGLPAIKIGDADRLRKGQFVVAIGNPYAIVSNGQPSASWGIVANLSQKVGSEVSLGDPQSSQPTLHQFGILIQTDAKLTFGTDGGALVNLRGELVGLTTSAAAIPGHELPAGYAVPMNAIFHRIINVLKEGREVEYGLLGIRFLADPNVTTPDGVPGVAVSDVPPGGPAARAGIQRGDIVTHVDGQPVGSPERLQLLVSTAPPAQPTPVRFQRGGVPQTVEVSLGKFPVDGRTVVTNEPTGWRGIHVDFVDVVTVANPGELGDDAVQGTLDPEGCVMVDKVEPGSPAWNAGVRPGMYISHVGERRVKTPGEFHEAVERADGVVNIRLTEPAAGQLPSVGGREREIPEAL